jgi:ABC-type Fe3+/spermidine/putrescine transport system ATPase subunit
MSQKAITIRGLEVHAPSGPTKARPRLLGPVDLDVEAGEHVLIVGPSGSGKTTLLRAIAGLSKPSAGEISLFGEPASRGAKLLVKPERRGLGYLFQGGALWPHKTVAGTLKFVLSAAGVPKGTWLDRIAKILDSVQLTGKEERLPSELSGGEAQRLNLARALVNEPRLVLFDEPLGPLDAPLRTALLERIGIIQKEQGWTALHVTHDPHGARGIATRTLHIDAGLIVKDESHTAITPKA